MKLKLLIWLKDYRFFQVFILGMVSGMPITLIFSTFGVWLKDFGISIEMITAIAIARMPYAFKALWSPIVDYFNIPILSRFGRRKSWMIITTSLITVLLFLMSGVNPLESFAYLMTLAIFLGLLSATYDIAYDAFRIELFDDHEQALGAATTILGYRIGMLITGAGALYLAGVTNNDWELVFQMLAAIFFFGLLFILTVQDKVTKSVEVSLESPHTKSLLNAINNSVVQPLKDLLGREGSIAILASIALYKLGEAMLGCVSNPFYMELGYVKEQIAIIAKGYGLIATLVGGYLGAILIYRLGNIKGMIVCGIAQSVANFMYIWLHYQPVVSSSLFVTIVCDNVTGGMGAVALISYLSMLCNKKYTATQYALLSSLASLASTTLVIKSGSLVKSLGWDAFFTLTVFLEIPALLFLIYIGNRFGFNKQLGKI